MKKFITILELTCFFTDGSTSSSYHTDYTELTQHIYNLTNPLSFYTVRGIQKEVIVNEDETEDTNNG